MRAGARVSSGVSTSSCVESSGVSEPGESVAAGVSTPGAIGMKFSTGGAGSRTIHHTTTAAMGVAIATATTRRQPSQRHHSQKISTPCCVHGEPKSEDYAKSIPVILRRYVAVRGSPGPIVSRISRNRLRASSSAFTSGNSASSCTA